MKDTLRNPEDTIEKAQVQTIVDTHDEVKAQVNTEEAQHMHWMAVALDQAKDALSIGEVPVGCVFVRNGRLLGAGRNATNVKFNATRHAELEAIDSILVDHDRSVFSGTRPKSLIFFRLRPEPCVMCASALRQLGVKKCFYGASNDRFGGCGSVLSVHNGPMHANAAAAAPLECHSGLFRKEAVMLLRKFYLGENQRAPAQLKRQKLDRQLKELS